MPTKGVKFTRAAQHLPVELVQRNSDLDILITLTGEAVEKKTFGFESTAKIARRLIRQNCSSYQPSTGHANDVLCRSGEDNGEPTRGSTCFKCRVSQFSRSGFFTGDMTTAAAPETSINPVMAYQSDLTISDLVKAHEDSL